MSVINSIANRKGWSYKKRSNKLERKSGYHFTCIKDASVFCRIVADNPVDAADHLKEWEEMMNGD